LPEAVSIPQLFTHCHCLDTLVNLTNTMTNQQCPITPPPELVQQWWEESNHRQYTGSEAEDYVVSMAAQWGWDQRGPEIQAAADQELEACCEWLDKEGWSGESRQLRAARRPKPPSLKEQALDAHNRMMAGEETQDDWAIVRRALEQLDD
jgi:hypothetical protein